MRPAEIYYHSIIPWIRVWWYFLESLFNSVVHHFKATELMITLLQCCWPVMGWIIYLLLLTSGLFYRSIVVVYEIVMMQSVGRTTLDWLNIFDIYTYHNEACIRISIFDWVYWQSLLVFMTEHSTIHWLVMYLRDRLLNC